MLTEAWQKCDHECRGLCLCAPCYLMQPHNSCKAAKQHHKMQYLQYASQYASQYATVIDLQQHCSPALQLPFHNAQTACIPVICCTLSCIQVHVHSVQVGIADISVVACSSMATSHDHVTELADSSCHCLQVEGLRNEYNRVTSGDKPKTGSSAASDDSSQLKQQAQSLQASTQSFALVLCTA